MKIVPCSLRDANAFTLAKHRHSGPTVGHKFSVRLVNDNGDTIGVGIASRPRSRALDDGYTIEIIRVTTDGTFNACSMIYGAIVRAAFAMGYTTAVTYTMVSEGGSSLKASGFRAIATTDGERKWDCVSRPRSMSNYPRVDRIRWQRDRGK